MNFDVAVAWRIYPKISKTPLVFENDKLSLVKLCLQSFQKSVEGLRVKYFFILDGCPNEYNQFIDSQFSNDVYEIIETDRIGNLPTFKLQIEILLKQTDADVVYFAEDDYLYVPGEFHKMVDLIKNNDKADFASCYLHKATFTHPIHKHIKETIEFDGNLWLNESSTCLTFITKKQTLTSTKDILMTYAKGNNDCAMWLVLTRTFIYNPLKYIQFYFTHKESYNILKVAIKYSFKYFFNFRKYNLFVSIPAIGTHLEKEFVSPGVNWIEIAKQVNKDNLVE